MLTFAEGFARGLDSRQSRHYLIGRAIYTAFFVLCVVGQIRVRRFHPSLYWLTIVATTTVGTTLADFADRSLGIGHVGGSTLLFVLLMTRPLGATVGDFLDKPRASGGLALDRFTASAVLAAFMIACILLFARRPASRPHDSKA